MAIWSPSWTVTASGVMVSEPTPLASSTVDTVVVGWPPKVTSAPPRVSVTVLLASLTGSVVLMSMRTLVWSTRT